MSNNNDIKMFNSSQTYDESSTTNDILFIDTLDNCTLLLNLVISVIGIVTNLINLVVFKKMGFEDTINISLFGLASSDFVFCVVMVAFSVCGTTWMKVTMLQFDVHPLLTSTFLGLLVQSVRLMTPLLTAYIAIERCLCVAMPLKIKSVLTPTRVVVVNACMLVYSVFRTVPSVIAYHFTRQFYPSWNTTLLNLVPVDKTIDDVTIAVDGVVYIVLTLFITVCTGVLIKHIKNANAAWLKHNQQGSNPPEKDAIRSRKSNKVVKMVTLITSLYIICFIPEVCVMAAIALVPGFYPDGQHSQLLFWSWHLVTTFFLINCVCNIFICYRNSSNYKIKFNLMFNLQIDGSSS